MEEGRFSVWALRILVNFFGFRKNQPGRLNAIHLTMARNFFNRSVMRSLFIHLTLCLFGILPDFLHAYPYLYVAQNNAQNLDVFDIANPRTPVPVPFTPALGVAAQSLAISPNGQVLYGSNPNAATLTIWDLENPQNPLFVQTVSGNTQPWGVLLHPSGRYLYLGDGTSNDITIYTLINQENPTRKLVTVPDRVNFFAVHPTGTYLYTIGATHKLQTFNISDPLNLTQTFSFTITSANLAIHPTGDFLYVIDSSALQLTVFSLATLSSPQQLPQNLPLGTNPQTVIVSPSQKYLYVTNQGDNTLSIFNIENPSTPIPETTFAPVALNSPSGLITSPNGSYLYVTNSGNNTISVVDISSEGSPVWIQNISTTHQPGYMAINSLFFKPFSRSINLIH